LPDHQVAAASAAVVALEVECVEDSVPEVVSEAVVALGVAMVDVEASEVVMEDLLEAAITMPLLLPLALHHQTPSPTSHPLEESQAS